MWSSVSGWVGLFRFQEEDRGGMGGAAPSVSDCVSLEPSGSAALVLQDSLEALSASQVLSGDKVIQFSFCSARRSS